MAVNVAFIGGGLPTLIALGGYSVVCNEINPISYSGDSMGATVVISLAVGKTPVEIRDFLAKNAAWFCIPRLGKEIMRREVNEFLGNLKFKDLPIDCFISIALSKSCRLKKVFPMIINRRNAGELTVGEVIAMSSSVPFLYAPSSLTIDGKKWKVYDGGLAINPPLNPNVKNALFSYENPASRKPNSWNKNARWPQEEKATAIFHPYTEKFKMLGGPKDVYAAFEFGKVAMQSEKEKFLKTLGN